MTYTGPDHIAQTMENYMHFEVRSIWYYFKAHAMYNITQIEWLRNLSGTDTKVITLQTSLRKNFEVVFSVVWLC